MRSNSDSWLSRSGKFMIMSSIDEFDIGRFAFAPVSHVTLLATHALAALAGRPSRSYLPSDSEDDGMAGAIHFARGESAFAEGDWEAAVNAFEDAYETGIDVAELHAMLAFSRYRTAEDDPEMVEHVVELLKYAEDLDPKLDSIYAFQGVVQLFGRGDKEAAKSCFNRAIALRPYSDLALEYIDQV